jgi:outer membrane protein TolC
LRHFRGQLIEAVLFFSLLVSSPLAVAAESSSTYSFAQVWRFAKARSPEINAADHELRAAKINETRQARHWYPRVFAEGRAFSTNDPALTFMSLLGQRQIAAPDFAAGALNQPGSGVFERGTLGFDLPLFEGGAKMASADAATHAAEASSYGRSSVQGKQYAEIATAYVSLLVLESQRRELSQLADGVEDTLSRYKIGERSNPVGYSGLLGLKNLKNRIQGLLIENDAKRAELRDRVRVVASELPSDWSPVSEDLRAFVEKHMPSKDGAGRSASEKAAYAAAEAMGKMKSAERAKFLPKVGLFGTGDLYGGSRSTATSYTAGAYVQWDLFSAIHFGAMGQAQHQAAAALARADGESQRSELARSGARHAIGSLEKNLTLMDESAKLLQEQTATARGLFRNGSITALQLVEVLARRADLLTSRADAQLGLIQARATLFTYAAADEVLHHEE